MPALEQMDRRQTALLWMASETSFDRYGSPTLAAPVEVQVRWNHVSRHGTNAQGEPVMITADVVLDRAVTLGSQMWLGEMEDWLGTGSGTLDPPRDVQTVVGYDQTRDIKGRNVRHEASLTKDKDANPSG